MSDEKRDLFQYGLDGFAEVSKGKITLSFTPGNGKGSFTFLLEDVMQPLKEMVKQTAPRLDWYSQILDYIMEKKSDGAKEITLAKEHGAFEYVIADMVENSEGRLTGKLYCGECKREYALSNCWASSHNDIGRVHLAGMAAVDIACPARHGILKVTTAIA